MLIFVHLPKTAGSTLRRILECEYGVEAIFLVDGYRIPEEVARARRLPPDEWQHLRVVMGHMWVGFHRVIPVPSTYVTILRHPVDRIASHYYYVLRTPESPLHREVVEDRLSLRDYVQRSRFAAVFNNGQIRLLGGDVDRPGVPAGEEHLTRAREVIVRRFPVVGVAERFDESVALMRRRFGWSMPRFMPQKVATSRPRADALPEDVVGAILERNRLDLELWEWAAARLERQLQQQDSSFWDEVAELRRLNPSPIP